MKQSVEAHAQERRVDAGVLAAMKRAQGWPKGRLISSEAFEAALRESLNAPLAPTPKPTLPDDVPERDTLLKAGYKSAADVRSASDKALLDLKGIGEATLREIREALK